MSYLVKFLGITVCAFLLMVFVVDYLTTRDTALQAWKWHISFVAPEVGKINSRLHFIERELGRRGK